MNELLEDGGGVLGADGGVHVPDDLTEAVHAGAHVQQVQQTPPVQCSPVIMRKKICIS